MIWFLKVDPILQDVRRYIIVVIIISPKFEIRAETKNG